VLTVFGANVAGMAMHQGRFDIAREALDEALSYDVEAPDRFIVVTIAIIQRVIQGEPYQAMLDEASEFAAAWHEQNALVQLNASRGWIGLIEGRYAEGAAASFRSVSIIASGASEDLPVAARASLWAEQPEDAQRALDQLRAIGGHGRMIHAQLTTMAAGIAAAEGRIEEAAASYGEAIRHWRELSSLFDMGLCELDFVKFVGGERPEVVAAADEARAIFREIGSPALLRRLDETLGLPVS
jgi:tetratricopeptide (TPR) repeat protein